MLRVHRGTQMQKRRCTRMQPTRPLIPYELAKKCGPPASGGISLGLSDVNSEKKKKKKSIKGNYRGKGGGQGL